MTDVVNLRLARKRKQRKERAEEAAENRLRFGRSGPQRLQETRDKRRRDDELDGKKLR